MGGVEQVADANERGRSIARVGRQELRGPAVDRSPRAADTNRASQVDNEQWQSAIEKNKARMDRLHDKIFKD
jgi:hypothetical protein